MCVSVQAPSCIGHSLDVQFIPCLRLKEIGCVYANATSMRPHMVASAWASKTAREMCGSDAAGASQLSGFKQGQQPWLIFRYYHRAYGLCQGCRLGLQCPAPLMLAISTRRIFSLAILDMQE